MNHPTQHTTPQPSLRPALRPTTRHLPGYPAPLRRATLRGADEAGFSLVELMTAITLSLGIIAGLVGLFVKSSQASSEIERANQQIESGSYGLTVLADNLQHAGFFAEFDPTVLANPAAEPDPCSVLVSGLVSGLPLHVQGYDNSHSLSCISDVRTGTDVLVVRRVGTCVAGASDCDAVSSGLPYFQASLCSGAAELGSPTATNYYALDTNTTTLTRTKRNCTTPADLRRFQTHIYYIANNDNPNDGIPTLKRAELDTSGGSMTFTLKPLVEGVENMQLEYGIDTNADGIPDGYSANPSGYNSCVTAACAVSNWRNVMAVKVNLLTRNTEKSAGFSDSKTYSLGLKADGSANTFGPYSDSYKRHVFQSMVRLTNPAGRREP